MKFSKQCKLSKAMAPSSHRCNGYESVKLVQNVGMEGGRLIATNGRILAIVNVTDTGDDTEERLIPGDAIAAATKGSKATEANLQSNGATRVYSGGGYQEFPTEEEVHSPDRFPDHAEVMPKGEAKITLTLNPKLLHDLALAIGSGDGLTLEIVPDSIDDKGNICGPIRVKPANLGTGSMADPDNSGVIMPAAV